MRCNLSYPVFTLLEFSGQLSMLDLLGEVENVPGAWGLGRSLKNIFSFNLESILRNQKRILGFEGQC